MIHDGPNAFPRSCVCYTRFKTFELKQMFAYLREREEIFKKDIEKYGGTAAETRFRAKLEEVEAQLIYMATNLSVEALDARQLGLW